MYLFLYGYAKHKNETDVAKDFRETRSTYVMTMEQKRFENRTEEVKLA